MGKYRGSEGEARGFIKKLILSKTDYTENMKKEQDDMTTDELSVHLDTFIDEQTVLLGQEIRDYNIRKSHYEKNYLVA